MEKRKRNISKILRLSAEEAKNLADNANIMGIDESSYLRRLIGQRPDDYPEIRNQLKQLINEVNHIGTNINQITHNNTSGYYSESDKRHLFAYMRKLIEAVDEVVVLLGCK